MFSNPDDPAREGGVTIVPEVIEYINRRGCDFRISTSCGGPILLPVHVKPPKKSDLLLKAGNQTVYVSIHQARFLHSIRADMIPFYDDVNADRHYSL